MAAKKIRELVIRLQRGEKEAGGELVTLLTPLVRAFAARLAPPSEREDLYQVGIIGLLKAADRFDPGSPTRFTTYAVPWIQGEIKQYRRSHLGPVKVSRRLREQWLTLERQRQKLSQRLGRSPTVSELAQEVEFSPEEIGLILEAAQPALPLAEDMLSLSPGLTEESALVDQISLYEGISRLAPLDRALIEMRFFREQTQAETAKQLSLTQRQVSRLEKRVLNQLKCYLQV
ncbi:MAG: sigma-70 family RNA polymerase sigma factor [Firmicutes bacterium]|nr:sigma-70 family RNA polymerase sigma factor [Bacillota bacterium]